MSLNLTPISSVGFKESNSNLARLLMDFTDGNASRSGTRRSRNGSFVSMPEE